MFSKTCRYKGFLDTDQLDFYSDIIQLYAYYRKKTTKNKLFK